MTTGPQEVLRGLRDAVLGDGPALVLGGDPPPAGAVAPGTAAVITTSGSTGVPKSVLLSRDALLAGARATAARIGEGAWLLALPPTYVAGMQVLLRSILSGREPAVLSGSFRPEAFVAATRGMDGPRYTSLVPVQLQRLLDAAGDAEAAAALRSFEAILVGGQALAPALAARAADAGLRLVRTYGSTETSGGCVYDGMPLDGVSLRIVDGEVQVAGPILADGYLGDAERTRAAFVRDGDGRRWYRTGDAGAVDGGILSVHGRLDNVIVSGGVNVSLDRVERVVRTVTGLEGAVVVGVEDATWGEASVIVAERDAAARGDELERARTAVAAALGAPARPARLVRVDTLAHLPSGKPDRVAIRRAAASAR